MENSTHKVHDLNEVLNRILSTKRDWKWKLRFFFRNEVLPFISPIYTFNWIFRPYNRLKVRNIPRSYHNPCWIAFHALMSVMCRFVENETHYYVADGGEGEKEGFDNFLQYVQRVKRDWEEDEEKRKTDPDYWGVPNWQYKCAMETLKLYQEYTTTDWYHCEDSEEKTDRMMKVAAEIYGGWWT